MLTASGQTNLYIFRDVYPVMRGTKMLDLIREQRAHDFKTNYYLKSHNARLKLASPISG